MRFFKSVLVVCSVPHALANQQMYPPNTARLKRRCPLCSSSARTALTSFGSFARPKFSWRLITLHLRIWAVLRASLPRGTGRSLLLRRAVAGRSLQILFAWPAYSPCLSWPRNPVGAISANERPATFDPCLWVAGWSLSSARGHLCS